MPTNWKTFKLDDLAQIGSSKRIYRTDYVDERILFFRSEKYFNKEIIDPLFIDPENSELDNIK